MKSYMLVHFNCIGFGSTNSVTQFAFGQETYNSYLRKPLANRGQISSGDDTVLRLLVAKAPKTRIIPTIVSITQIGKIS